MLLHLCGFLLGVLLNPDLCQAKFISDYDTETKGRYDPCFNSRHIEIDDYTRSTQILVNSTEIENDDGNIPYYWYRFTSGVGGEIPTSCPPMGQCNAIHPMWMKGTIPPDDDKEHTVQMCVNDATCEYNCQDALIKNCTEYLVYKLRPAPTAYAAYCAGSGSKCQEGEDSPTGFTPCEKVKNIPAVPKPPKVDLDADQPVYFYGRCKLTDPDLTVEHDVRWKANGNIFHRQTLEKGKTVALVSEVDMKFRNRTIVGYHIRCEVSARKENFKVGSKFRLDEEGYFLGIQFVNGQGEEIKELTVKEKNNTPTYLYLKTTAPVRCNHASYHKAKNWKPDLACAITVKVRNMDLEEYYEQLYGECERGQTSGVATPKQLAAKLSFGTCEQTLTDTNWKDYTAHKIPVTALADKIPDGIQVRYIDLMVSATYQRVWDRYEPPWVKVTIEDQQVEAVANQTCTSMNDPHMTTFDGVEYENMLVGEFVLYENVELNFRVHVFFIKCNKNIASCNCGVAAQAGDDVILLDRCNKLGDLVFDNDNKIPEEDRGIGYMRQRVLPLGEMTPGFKLEHTVETNSYKIKFPHGAELHITLDDIKEKRTEWINLKMVPSAEDFAKPGTPQKVRGLCGTYSNDHRDDLQMRDGSHYDRKASDERGDKYFPDGFSKHWRIPKGDKRSMYNGNIQFTGKKYKHKKCVCLRAGGEEAVQCVFNSLCDDAQNQTLDMTALLADIGKQRRRRRDAGHDYVRDHDDLDLQFNPGSEGDIRPEERWTTDGMSKRDARAFCNRLIKTAAFYEKCNALDNMNFESDIKMCITDIGLVRTTQYAKGALDRAEMKCKDRVESDMSLWTDDLFQPPPPLRYKLFLEQKEAASDASGIIGANRPAGEFDEIDGRRVLTIKHGSINTDKNQAPNPEIVGKICPEACNARGKCKNGKCLCEPGWVGKACSFHRDKPRVYSLPRDGVCDRQSRPCHRTPVHGMNFIETKDIRCIFVLVNDSESRAVSTNPEIESYQEIHCPIPGDHKARAVVEYDIQVTNDYQDSSMISERTLRLRVFDSNCYQCTSVGCNRTNLEHYCIDTVTQACVPRRSMCNLLTRSFEQSTNTSQLISYAESSCTITPHTYSYCSRIKNNFMKSSMDVTVMMCCIIISSIRFWW